MAGDDASVINSNYLGYPWSEEEEVLRGHVRNTSSDVDVALQYEYLVAVE